MSLLGDLETSIGEVAGRVGPAVVGLGRRWGGSGVVVAPGRVLTNAHNLRHDELTVTFADGRQASARVAGSDGDLDVAVLDVDTEEIEPVEWARVDGELSIGRAVFALANPAGRGLRVTPGFVSATARSFRGPRGRKIAGALEHTAPLPRGSSGGPLVDRDGRLVGINSIRVDGGLILAIPADSTLARARRRAGPRRDPEARASRCRDRAAARGAQAPACGWAAGTRRRAGARGRRRQRRRPCRDRAG